MSINQNGNRGKADNHTNRDGRGNGQANGDGRRPRGNHNRNGDKGKSSGKKFAGLNQAELKGIVITDDVNIPTSQQFDTLYEALIVYGSTKNSHVATALRRLKAVTQDDLMPKKPNKEDYTKVVESDDGTLNTVEDDTMRNALMSVWAEEAKLAKKQYIAYAEDLRKLFGSIQGQLDHGVKEQLKSDGGWDKMAIESDTIALIKKLREVCYRDSTSKVNPVVDLCSKMRKFLNSKQDPSRPDSKFVEETKIKFDVLKSAGGSVISNELITYTLKRVFPEKRYAYGDYLKLADGSDVDKQEHKIITKAAEQMMIATVIIVGSNYKAHRDMPQFLEDQYAMGNDCYPINPPAAQDLLNQYRVRKFNHLIAKHGNNDRNGHGKNGPNRGNKADANGIALINHGIDNDEKKNDIDEARQMLMRGSEGDEHQFFLCQIGHETNEKANEPRDHNREQDIEDMVMVVGKAQFRNDDDGWYATVTEKLRRINIRHVNDFPEDPNIVNERLSNLGLPRFHKTTLHGFKSAVEDINGATLDASDASKEIFDILVAAGPQRNPHGWAHVNFYKLGLLNIQDVHQLVIRLPTINDDIKMLGLPRFDRRSIMAMDKAAKRRVHDNQLGDSDGFQMVHASDISDIENRFMFAQGKGAVDKNWILLDSQATCNVIMNRQMLQNIQRHPDGRIIHIHCNAGVVTVKEVGMLEGFGMVWHYKDGIANVLSLALVSDRFRVTLDTDISQAFYVHRTDGTTRKFARTDCNLYACDMRKNDEAILNITTVEGQMRSYSDLDIRRAKKARKLQEILGFPSTKALLKMIDNNMIKNCPVTRRDMLMAEDMFGVNTNIVKGKTVRRRPGHVREDISNVPPDILKNYREVTLGMDIFHVNGIKFLRTISRHLMFRTSTCIRNANASNIVRCIKSVQAKYKQRGFFVKQIFGDNEFESVSEKLNEMGIMFSAVARGAHEPFIERDNRTSKERARCMFASIPFKRLPMRMTIEMISAVDFWLNSWCSSGGVSTSVPPREIITGIKLDAAKHTKFQFGDYVLSHNETDNTMRPRAHDGIYLRPTGNENGGFYVFDLQTERRVHRMNATAAHMTQTIINKVEQIAKDQGCPTGIIFGNSEGGTTINDMETNDIPSDDDASDGTYQEEEEDEESVGTTFTATTMEDYLSDDSYKGNPSDVQTGYRADEDESGEEEEKNTQEGPSSSDDEDPSDKSDDEEDNDENETQQVGGAEQPTTPDERTGIEANHTDNGESPRVGPTTLNTDVTDDGESAGVEPTTADANDDHAGTDASNHETRRMTLRPRVTRTHNKFGSSEGFTPATHHRSMFTAGFGPAIHELETESKEFMFVAAAISEFNDAKASQITPQYGIQKGLRVFGDAGVEAVLKELRQLHEREVIIPVHPKRLTRDELKRSLPYLMFLKRKRCGKVKGRGCADGRSQREFISKDEASSPTVSLYALMVCCAINAIENRYVITADIPGAFLQTDMPNDEVVHVRLDGAMAELLAKLDPEKYNPCITTDRSGKKKLYARANKAIYGTLRAALLFWENLSGKLQEWGFEINPYDHCTANKMINGKQCTINWHVDDLMISHVDEAVVNDILHDLNKEYGKISPLTETRGKVHEYVGMTIDYSENGKVKFTMRDYLEDIIANMPERLKPTRFMVTPAGDHLFKVNEDAIKLNQRDSDTFHQYVAKLLFAAKRARPDIQTAVAFLCTRVHRPDMDDWKKLSRVLGYIKETLFLPLVLGWDKTGNAYWYVDASFAVHQNMRSHTGGVLTFGHGAVISISTKQKINTKSSTEAELVGVDDILPFNIWCHYFLQWQGLHSQGHDNEAIRKLTQYDVKPNDDGTFHTTYIGHNNVLYQDNTSSIKLENNGKMSSTKRTRHIHIRYFTITDKIKRGDVMVEYCPTKEMIADFFTKPLQGSLFKQFRSLIMGVSDAEYIAYRHQYEESKRDNHITTCGAG